MKATNSPLQIIDFALTRMDFHTITPADASSDHLDMAALFNEYEVDIDFGIEMKQFIAVRVIAKINYGSKKLPGYSICAEAGTFYRFGDDIALTDQQRAEIEGFSTIYIGLNVLRGLISGFTANAPFGRYILPSINLNELIAAKRKELQLGNEKLETKNIEKKRIKKNVTKPKQPAGKSK